MRSLHPWPVFPFNLDPPITRSLSIQFILQELIFSFELFSSLRQITPEKIQGNDLKEEIAYIFKQLEKFLLFSLETPLSQKGSSLDKLCFYCENLLQASRIGETEIPILLDEMKSLVLKMKAKMTVWKKMLTSPDQILTYLSELYTTLHRKLCQFFHALTIYLKEARSDENVLVYLIENKDKLNSYLGDRHIEQMLESFFPTGFAQLRAAVIEGYTRRGFSAFLAKVEPLIDAIEWETAVH